MRCAYNGIELKVVKTHSFVMQPLWSSDGCDWIANRYYIDVSCVYNPGATSYAPGRAASPGMAPAATSAAIAHYLNEPRASLIFQDESGNVVVSSPAAGNTRDAVDGPKPIHVSVHEIMGQKTWLVRFAVETFVCDCPGGSGPILSNRWSNSQQVGEDQMTTITTAGETRFRMDALENLGASADAFRGRAIPPCPLGFRRIGLNCQVNTVGDRIVWQSVDRQQYYALGDSQTSAAPDVLSFEGSFTQQTMTQSESAIPSGWIMAAVTIGVQGKPAASRAALMDWAIKMALNRIWQAGVPAANPDVDGYITRVAAKEDLHQPSVSIHIEAQMPAANQGAAGLGGLRADKFLAQGVAYQFSNPLMNAFGLTPDLGADNNTRSPAYLGQAFAAALQAACTPPPVPLGPPGPGSGGGGYNISASYNFGVAVGSSIPIDQIQTLWSQENTDAVYTTYRIDNRYDTKESKLVAPIADTGPQKGKTDDQGNWVPSDPQTPTAEIMTMARAVTYMVSEWIAERVGKPPTIPSPTPTDPTFVLIAKSVQQTNAVVVPGGQTKAYSVSGRYEYIMKRPVYNECMRMFPKTPNIGYYDGVGEFLKDLRPGLIMDNGANEAQDAPPSPGGVVGQIIGIVGGNI